MRWSGSLVLSSVVLALASSSASAQASVFFGGGATIPAGDFGDYAKTGWVGVAGITAEVGGRGVWLGGEGFFGSNKHEGGSDKTNLYGVNGLLGYNFQTAGGVQPYVYTGAGILAHQYKPGSSTASSETESQFNWLGAGGIAIAASPRAQVWIEGRYNGARDTQHLAIMGGLTLRVGRR
jgi:hypothetical protein